MCCPGFYDDYYGAYFDDFADLPACPYGTDCTDCQPLHGDAHYTEVKDAECDNTCEFSRDGFCDDTRTNGYCKLGTDCQDCGPASAGNYSTYDDDAWWDDDASNWYWDDDYFALVPGESRTIHGTFSAGMTGPAEAPTAMLVVESLNAALNRASV